MTLLKRFDNIDVLCTDIPKMAAFYHDVLELPFLFPHEEGEDWFAVQSGDVTLYFFPGSGPHAPRFAANSDLNPPGIECFAFSVADLDEAIQALEGKVEWIDDVEEWRHPSGSWYRFRYLYDPEGNKLSITEPHR